jgi:hypothetical protein
MTNDVAKAVAAMLKGVDSLGHDLTTCSDYASESTVTYAMYVQEAEAAQGSASAADSL